MNVGLGLQVIDLAMLMVPAAALTVPWVMAAQSLSGIAKDLNKMSAKVTAPYRPGQGWGARHHGALGPGIGWPAGAAAAS